MQDFEILQQRIEVILNSVPDDLILEWHFDSGLVVWSITQKPIGFSVEDEEKLMLKLNSINNESTMLE